MTERRNDMVVAICGAGHSGSTLLGLVLGSHSQAAYAGEAKRRYSGVVNTPPQKKHCKICGERCEIWQHVPTSSSPSELYELCARATGRPDVSDSSKEVEWLCARAVELDAARIPYKLVYLTRDGRGVLNSRLRKYSDLPVDRLIA